MKTSYVMEFTNRLIRSSFFLIALALDFVSIIANLIGEFQIPRGIFIGLLVTGLVAGSYQVFVNIKEESQDAIREREEENLRLQEKIREYEDRKPFIVVGFNVNGNISQQLEITLMPIPEEPDYETLVANERRQLLAPKEDPESPSDILKALGTLASLAGGLRNNNYEEDVEKYLKAYQYYLKLEYKYGIVKDRLRLFYPMAVNQGRYATESVTFEIIFSESCSATSSEDLFEDYYTYQEEPEKPKRPEKYIDFPRHLPAYPIFTPGDISLPQDLGLARNDKTTGPEFLTKNPTVQVKYSIERLIPNLPELNLDGFPIWLGKIEKDELIELPVLIYSADLSEPMKDSLIINVRIEDID